MSKDKSAEKRTWAPNEAPTGRWIGFFVAGLVAMSIAQGIFQAIQEVWKMDGVWAWVPGILCPLLGFALTYALLALLCKAICKTSVRDLLLNSTGTFDKKLCLKMCAAIIAGTVLEAVVLNVFFPDPTATMEINSIGAVPIIVNLALCGGLLWMQTTSEEILFRCPFLRAGGGDKLEPGKKALLWAFISCAVFMLMHASNPEVKTQGSALAVVVTLAGYLVAAVGMYAADVVYRTPLAGCAIHWMNNFINIALFCQAGTAVESGSLFWVTGAINGTASLVGTICLFIPVVVLMVVDTRKKKLAA